jgi:hypothetical protein
VLLVVLAVTTVFVVVVVVAFQVEKYSLWSLRL